MNHQSHIRHEDRWEFLGSLVFPKNLWPKNTSNKDFQNDSIIKMRLSIRIFSLHL
jgi:hypothetical protein